MIEDPIPDLQRDVQRLLGRCVLRIQQYERLMKAFLAAREWTSTLDDPQPRCDARAERLADKSLGTLVKTLFDEAVVSETDGHTSFSETDSSANQAFVKVSFQVALQPSDLDTTRTAMAELVKMRNDFVHHLIERFDLRTEAGCLAAARHLEACYERIELHLTELRRWVDGFDEARELMASHAPAIHDLLVDGLAPDGRVAWSGSGIVRALREAAQVQSVDGWARLDRACDWIGSFRPEQIPRRYGCRTWRQVVHESGQFDLVYRRQPDGRRVAWFRVRSA